MFGTHRTIHGSGGFYGPGARASPVQVRADRRVRLSAVLPAVGCVLLSLLALTVAYADDPLDDFPVPLGTEWAQLYPESFGRSIVAVPSGYVVAGKQNGPSTSSSLDLWTVLVAYGTDGTLADQKTFHLDADHNEAFDIIPSYGAGDTLDGYVVAGAKHQAFSEEGHDYYNPYVWLTKVGPDLEPVWESTFGDPFPDYGYAAFWDGSGFVVSGQYSNPNTSAYLLRTDASGVLTWEASWATDPRWLFMPVIHDVVPAPGGGLVVATESGLHKLGAYTSTSRPPDVALWSVAITDDLRSVIAVPGGYVATGSTQISGDTEHADLVLLKVTDAGSIAWRHTYGRASPTLGASGMNDSGSEVIAASDGGFVVVGTTYSYAWHGSSDVWLLKTDATGNIAWDIVAGDSGADNGAGVVQDAAGALVVTGTATYDEGLGGGPAPWIYAIRLPGGYLPPSPAFTYAPRSPFFVEEPVHFDASGSTAGGPGDAVVLYEWDFGDGSTGTGIETTHTYLAPGSYTVTLFVTDSNGIRRETSQGVTAVGLNVQWERKFGNGSDWFYDLAEDGSGGALLCGINCISSTNCGTWIAKVDNRGETVWNGVYPDTYYGGRDGAQKAIRGHDGHFLVAGFRDKATTGETRDVRILKVHADTGVKIWDKSFNYAGSGDEAVDIKLVPGGGYIVAGYATTGIDVDAWLIRIDEDGNVTWHRTYSNTGDQILRGNAVATVTGGGFLIVGTETGTFSSQPIIAIRTDSTGVEQWRYTIPYEAGSRSTAVKWATQLPDGSFIIAGTLSDDYALIMLAANGSSHEAISWGGTYQYDYIDDADITPDGGYVVTGTRYDPVTDNDTYVARLDNLGNLAWEEGFGDVGVAGENGEGVGYLDDGSVLVLHSDYFDGVMRLTRIGPNALPSGDFVYSPAEPVATQPVTFTATLTDIDGSIVSWIWQFGAGQGEPVETAVRFIDHTYAAAGSYDVSLRAFDDSGGELSVTRSILVGEAPEDLCPADPDKLEPGVCGCGVADDDTDHDGIADCVDNCPSVANADQRDTDGDTLGNACDDDDHNDGMPDAWEKAYLGLDPLVDDADGDVDRDGVSNLEEYLAGTEPAPRVVVGALPAILILLSD
ncbi:MAG: PKD domain-containing protein [Gammaproteobacteria bacterium]|nr:PKD domain-containing protein [Gammaproteobacteria bacterium]